MDIAIVVSRSKRNELVRERTLNLDSKWGGILGGDRLSIEGVWLYFVERLRNFKWIETYSQSCSKDT